MNTTELKKIIEQSIDDKIRHKHRQDRHKWVYSLLEEVLPESDYCEFLQTILWGFEGLEFDDHHQKERYWRKEVEELKAEIKSVLSKNRRLGNPFDIKVATPLNSFTWETRLARGRPKKDYETYLINKMTSLLIGKTTQEKISFIIADVFLYFYGIDKDIDTLAKHYIRKLKKRT